MEAGICSRASSSSDMRARQAQPSLDFIFTSPFGSLGVKPATTKPAQQSRVQLPDTQEQIKAYLENFIPMKLGRALRRKLEKKSPYWTTPQMDGLPL